MSRDTLWRRGRVLATMTLLLTLAPLVTARAEDGPAARKRPNVVLILSDDQRPDTIHALGNRLIRTPNLDRLVREGTAFTRAVSPNPLCVPSRAEILSGCTGFRNGVLPPLSSQLDPHLVLWPEAMRRAGYRTWYSGKWHTQGRPTTRGFDETLGLYAGGASPGPERLDSRGRPITGYVGWVFQDDAGHRFPERGVGLNPDTNVRIADAAVELIGRKAERPFFLEVCFPAPHDPLILPPGTSLAYDPATIPLPANFLPEHPFDHGNLRGRDEALLPWPRTPRMVRDELALYYTLITHLDAQVGRILDALDQSGQRDRTLVVFSSDHGLAIGSHGLRGKQNMYEHTVNVPLILSGPQVPRGQTRHAQVYLRDLYPTVCELAGVPIPQDVQGHSFARVLTGGKDEGERLVFGYFMDVQRMVRGDRWKLIEYPKQSRWQLFDLVSDPTEQHDLSAEPKYAPVLEQLRGELRTWQKQQGDPLLKS